MLSSHHAKEKADNRHALKFLNDVLYSICNISIFLYYDGDDMKCDSINFMLLFLGWPDHYEIASDAPALYANSLRYNYSVDNYI